MISLKNSDQIAKMREAGALLYEVHQKLRAEIKPGVTTWDLDAYAESLIRKAGAIPSFKGYQGFPATLCTSVDDAVVHGIPNKKQVLQEGQIISVDCGLILDGWQSDSAFTAGVGKISDDAQRLIDITEECFWRSARQCVAGNRLGDVGYACQEYAESNGCGVIRDLTGHGIGREMHEEPEVPNYGKAGHGPRLVPGMTICIEPMVAQKNWKIKVLSDGWTAVTCDGGLAAHFEHTVLITPKGPVILTQP